MKYLELMEGVEPKLPGAPSGIKIMTPQQFVSKDTEELDEALGLELINELPMLVKSFWEELKTTAKREPSETLEMLKIGKKLFDTGKITPEEEERMNKQWKDVLYATLSGLAITTAGMTGGLGIGAAGATGATGAYLLIRFKRWIKDKGLKEVILLLRKFKINAFSELWNELSTTRSTKSNTPIEKELWKARTGAEGFAEATKLPADTRPFGDEELTSYLDRIRNKEKKKTDKYKYPYIHRSSVVGYYNEAGKKYDTDAIKNGLKERPKALLKKNEKMKHSDGAEEQFFNIGFAALVGVAVDENTDELVIVNTCPGAGSCKIDCFAMKGGKIQFQGPWLSDGRILTFLLNDPTGFFTQLKTEITKEMNKGKKGGYKVSIRWHDAGDFFSPEYMDMAFKLAEELPDVDFYAYTKVAKVALANKPKNFMINWSEGAAQSQEREIKSQDPELEVTKNSRIVPNEIFYDLLVKDEKKNLVKGPEGQWQVIPDKLPELKDRLANKYGLSKNSILSYSEWEDKGRKNPLMKWNVIIAPGEPDLTAKDPGVLSTLLLKH